MELINKYLIEPTKWVFSSEDLWGGAAIGILVVLPDVLPQTRFAGYTLFLACIGMFIAISIKKQGVTL